MEQFTYTEQSDYKLNEQLVDLLEARNINHNETRRNELARRLAHLLFEIRCREAVNE